MLVNVLNASRKVVIKIGSNTLSNEDGKIDLEFLEEFAMQVDALLKQGKQIVIVSSGAAIAGVSTIDKWLRKGDIHYKQALCAIGQVELMNAYRQAFAEHGISIGQLLLTRDDFFEPTRSLNMRNTLFTLIDEGVIPIINENDTVSVEEIKIGDNDTLAALTANLWNADLLILLSDVDGVYDKNPKEYGNARLIEKVSNIDSLLAEIDIGEANSFGTGGIVTKIEAARRVNKFGIPLVLTNGRKVDLSASQIKGTLFTN